MKLQLDTKKSLQGSISLQYLPKAVEIDNLTSYWVHILAIDEWVPPGYYHFVATWNTNQQGTEVDCSATPYHLAPKMPILDGIVSLTFTVDDIPASVGTPYNASSQGIIPISGTIWTPNPLSDINWLYCNGSIFDDKFFPDLFAILGSRNLPDLVNYSPVGTGLVAAGTTAGATTSSGVGPHWHTTGTESAYHQHTPMDGGFVKTGYANDAGLDIPTTGGSYALGYHTNSQNATHTHNTNPVGVSFPILNPGWGGYWYMRGK